MESSKFNQRKSSNKFINVLPIIQIHSLMVYGLYSLSLLCLRFPINGIKMGGCIPDIGVVHQVDLFILCQVGQVGKMKKLKVEEIKSCLTNMT